MSLIKRVLTPSFIILFLIAQSCQDHSTGPAIPKLTTADITAITQITASGGGNITDDGGSTILTRGVCFGTSPAPTTDGTKTSDGTGKGSFVSALTNLVPNTKYYVRAYATNKVGVAYGNEISFTTSATATPVLTTVAISSITSTSAASGGNITADGASAVTARGVCWSTSTAPTTSGSKSSDGTGTGAFVSSLTGLSPGTTYYVRAYATNGVGTSYGNEVSFTTSATAAQLTTTAISSVTGTTASSGGSVTNDGGAAITARGVCYNTSTTPTISNSKTSDGTGTGTFVSSLTGLSPGTTYYVRAYATNSTGTAYGNELSFTTASLPTLTTTTTISAITHNSASGGGNISSDGGAAVTARGIVFSTITGPTTADSKTTDGAGTGTFVSQLASLTLSTTYFVRAYATNLVGTAYGNEVSFTTNANSTVTLLNTKDASIFNNAAGNAANGNYGSGGSQVLQVGFSSSASMYARTLLQFDVSSLPSDAVIETVSLQLTDAVSGANVPLISVYAVTQSWTEGSTTDACVTTTGCNILGSVIAPGGNDVTWNVTDFSTSAAWSTLGGSFNASASATSADAGASLNTFTSSGLVTDVQGWMTNAATNFGWILKITEPTTGTGKIKRYASRNSTSTQPKLVITYH